MRFTPLLFALAALTLSACGTSEKTVVVQPRDGSTVVVTPHGDTSVTPN